MKPIKDTIEESMVSEARQEQFRVAFNDFKDDDDLPLSVTIMVDSEYRGDFRDFLKKEEGRIFAHADGAGIQY